MLIDFIGSVLLTLVAIVFAYIVYFKILNTFRKPRLDRNWFGLFARLPSITIEQGGQIFAKNVREATYNPNFEYECKVEYTNKKYNLNDLNRLWLFVNPYDLFQSHAILSFEFGNEEVKSYLTVSYELRKVNPASFNTKKVLFWNYEGHFILAPEEDTIFVRTNVRHNYENTDLYMFPIKIDITTLRNMFIDISKEINKYETQAFFYGLYGRSCLTEIFKYFKKYNLVNYRTNFALSNILKLIYNHNIVDGFDKEKESFNTFKSKYYITDKVQSFKPDSNFSINIRNL